MEILIIANRKNPRSIDALFQLSAYLDSQGIGHSEIDVAELPDSAYPKKATREEAAKRYSGARGYELIVTLGGDGSILHAARLADIYEAPILGINFGHMGFLANTVDEGAIALLADALAGEIIHEKRMNLHVEVECAGDEPIEDVGEEAGAEASEDVADRPSEEINLAQPREFFALNEIAIARGALGHILDFDFSVSGDKVAHMRGDGLIVATATGSTAYSLSAGGPLVGPEHRGMIVTPLAPHTLNSRAIVCEHHDVVELEFAEDGASAAEASLFADGDALHFDSPISRVRIRLGERPTVLLTRREESFYRQIARTFFA